MANATLSAPSGLKTANFSINVSFGTRVTGFEKTDVNLRALDGHGTTGVDFSLTGTGGTYTLNFTLPNNKQGIFEVSVTGMVTPEGKSNPEAVMGNTVVVVYGTTAQITVTFGTPVYREGGVIEVPLTFGESVIAPAKTVFEVLHASGDALTDVTYYIVGTGKTRTLIFEVPPDRTGSFNITANGSVLKASTQVWHSLVGSPATRTVNYDTRVPFIKNYDIPANYVHGEKFDVVFQFNVPVTFVPPKERFGSDDATYLDHFIFEGADLGTPNLYRKKDNTYPTDEIGTVSDTNAAPPTADWGAPSTVIPSEIYLLRYAAVSPSAVGIFNITLKEESVRGPSGAPPAAQEQNYVADGAGNFIGDGAGNYIGTGNP